MIELSIKNKLLARSEIVALVSTRIYYSILPQNPVLPAISFFKVSNYRPHDLDIALPRFQFDSWSTTYAQATQIANEIRLALQREKGTWTGMSIIQGIYLNEEMFYENDTKIYHIASDFNIIYMGI